MNSKSETFGTLFIVSTPLGNLKDISFRAIEVLQKVRWIAAEDTRHSIALLKHYNIQTPMKSFHEHNESQRIALIEKELIQGEDIALMSDAGTPLISDPGYGLIRHLTEKKFKVSPVPGACAVIAALSAAGLPTDRFIFEGFLSAKSTARCIQLQTRQYESATLIFYEAPHRLVSCLSDMTIVFGAERQAVIARELTKTFEDFQRGTLSTLFKYYKNHSNQQRGEITICVAGASDKKSSTIDAEKILKILLAELPLKKAAQCAAKITGLKKNELYTMALK